MTECFNFDVLFTVCVSVAIVAFTMMIAALAGGVVYLVWTFFREEL